LKESISIVENDISRLDVNNVTHEKEVNEQMSNVIKYDLKFLISTIIVFQVHYNRSKVKAEISY
jgi:hypothetical protein